jgi:hypothetical protein
LETAEECRGISILREGVCPAGSWSSSVLPPRWSPRRSTLDSEVGASALAEGSNPIPPDSGLSKARPSERERGGEQGRAKSPDGRTPSTGYHHSPRPPAEAPASSRLTGILGCLSHLRHRASDRVSRRVRRMRAVAHLPSRSCEPGGLDGDDLRRAVAGRPRARPRIASQRLGEKPR